MSGRADPVFTQSATLLDTVHDSLRQRIATGEIGAGERVTEARVVADYGIARPTAKSCIERLVHAGLLQRVAHRSATVTRLAAADIDDLFFVRANIELAAARRVAEQRSVPQGMLDAQRALDLAGEIDDRGALVRADVDFHSSMVEASGSRRLARAHEQLMGEILLTIGSSGHRSARISVVAAEHAAILASLRAGRADDAADLLGKHLAAAHRRVLDTFD